MNAKDTVMAKASVKRYCIGSCGKCEVSKCFLDELAEISFKAGRESMAEEVAEWMVKYLFTKNGR